MKSDRWFLMMVGCLLLGGCARLGVGPPEATFVPLDSLLERAEAWEPATDRLRPVVQAQETRGTPRALCFEVPTDLGPFREDVFQNPQVPCRFARLPESLDLSRFTRLTVWAKETGRRASFIRVGLSAERKVWGKDLVCVYNSAPIDRGPWREHVLNFHHLEPAKRQKLRYLFVMSVCVGHQPDEEPLTRVYLDDWRLSNPPQRRASGWGADPDVVTVSQAGFRRFSEKMALVPAGCPASEFTIRRAGSGAAVLRGKLEAIEGPLGRYKVARFDGLTRAGRYYVAAGPLRSLHFRIADDVLAEPLRCAYGWLRDMRCGCATRRHMPCHLDDALWGARHLVKVYNALGWFPLKIRDWPDYRRGNYWTDNVVGTGDDRRVIETPFDLDTEGDVMTLAGMLATDAPPEHRALAERLLAVARARFERFWDPALPKETWRANEVKDWHGYHFAHWTRGMLELYKATRDTSYLGPLHDYARAILDHQKREWPEGATRPLCGEIFSWGRACRDRDLPEELLALLCEALPEHPDWYEWHFALVRGVEHWHKPIRAFWRPFSLPQLEQDDRLARPAAYPPPPGAAADSRRFHTVPESLGVRISEAGPRSVTVVPYAGCHELPDTAASLMKVARALNDPDLERLVTWQVQWALGHNPFNLSFIVDYGEDCITQPYSFSQGRLLGSVTIDFGLGEDGMPRAVRPEGSEVCVYPGRMLIEALGELAAPATVELRLLDAGRPYRGKAEVWWPRGNERVASARTDREGQLPTIHLTGGETYELRVPHPKGLFRLALPVVSGSMYQRTIDLAGRLVLEAVRAPGSVASGQPFRVEVTVANHGHSTASGRVRALGADCRIVGSGEQAVEVPGRSARALAWELVSGAARRPFIVRFELDGNHARGLDATGTIGAP